MKKQLLSLFMLFLASSTFAQQVGMDEARQRAMSFLQSQHVRKAQGQNGQTVSTQDIELAYISKRKADQKVCFYVFNQANDGGFVIVGGDESAKDILGYSNNGSFDYENAPDNFKWWLSQYEEQISVAMDNPEVYISAKNKAKRKTNGSDRHDVAPLIKTKWNQSEPFNNAIPSLGSNYAPFVTGCVATAMAQVLNYHKYPTQGYGSNSFNKSWTQGTLTFQADFGATTYDWGNMLNTYTKGSYTEAQANAVATLMYHCGVSVNMNYDSAKNGGSGASSSNIPNAISTYFGYDKSAQHIQRKYYTDEEWTDIIYGELAAGRPILYGGQDAYSNSGHEFVCHGYDASNQTFAINWGWGGSSDGYFTLMGVDGLQPGGSGIGGAGDGASYTREQDIIINVMPDQGGTYPLVIYNARNNAPAMKNQNGIPVTTAQYDLSNTGTGTIEYTFYPWNLSNDTRTIQTAVMLKDVVSGVCLYTENISGSITLDRTSLYPQEITIKPSDFQFNGTYEVYPVVREKASDPWQRILVDRNNSNYTYVVPTIEIIGGENPTKSDITFEISGTTVEERGKLQITHDKFYNGHITYSATPADAVSIDANGVVTALKAGNVKITAKGEESTYFNETSETFDVTITPYVKKNIEFSIDDTNVMEGLKLTISHVAPDYTGTITYSSSDNNIASVDANGVITGINKGKATITATATEDELYMQTSKSFDIIVTNPGIALLEYNLPNNGYVTMKSFNFTAKVKNNTSSNWSTYYLKCKIPFDSSQIIPVSSEPFKIFSGEEATVTFNIYNKYGSYFPYFFKTGDKITTCIEDYDGNQISEPITFEFCNELSIDYTMTAAGWGTICLPFEADVPDGLIAYSVTETNGNKLVMEEADKLEMNTPYLLNGTEGTYTFKGPDTPTGSNYKSGILVGNTEPSYEEHYVYAPQSSYVLQNNSQGLGFYKVENNNSQKVRQYSAYLTDTTYPTNTYFNVNETITSVETLQQIAKDAPAYNLNGIRVNRNAKGFVIINGKLIYNK